MNVFDLNHLAQFDSTKPKAQLVARSKHARQILFAFRVGQGLREHSTHSQIAAQVITGRLTFTAKGECQILIPGQLLLLEANVIHSMHTESDTVMLLTMTPDPQR